MSDLSEMVYVKIDKDLKERIENYRRSFDKIPSRSQAIRDLVIAGLDARE